MSAESVPRSAELHIVITSPDCASFRLVAEGRIIWRNRVYNRPEGHAGARGRMTAWAAQHGYRIVERKEERKRA
jgi:hypothetical protein